MKTIVIMSSCAEEWGGSEELWALSIPHLQQRGFNVVVIKEKINLAHPRFVQLKEMGVKLLELNPALQVALKLTSWLLRSFLNIALGRPKPILDMKPGEAYLIKILKQFDPQLVVVSQGSNFDGLGFAYACKLAGLHYVVVSQKAVDFYWPMAPYRKGMADVFLEAKKSFFVSRHNLKLSEEQFGVRFPNASVIFNPVKVPVKPVPFPDISSGYHLACIGRFWVFDKGQDMLLRVLAQDKWRERPITISFIGKGVDEEALKDMAALYSLKNVRFIGFVDDMQNLWSSYHALILPSRNEGLPLVVLEAMAAGRPVIVTNAGGTAEIVEDGTTGFVGEVGDLSLDEVMERAWIDRDKWEAMGREASAYIKQNVPAKPEVEFVDQLMALL